jgi:2-succinyl-5-enolpyruvyl-6-hydroxy-3-cyclohexene-1-carboxylate synthase
LENDSFQKLISPEIIVQFGKTPINKKILDFFKNSKSVKVLVNEYGELFDPSKTVNEIYSISENSVANFANDVLKSIEQRTISGEYKVVVGLNKKVESIKLTELNEYPFMFEGNIFSFVSEVINIDIPIVVSNSMPVRYFDLFSLQKKSNNKIYCNRGASGIDGNTATSAGISFAINKPTLFISGDLAFLHDIGSLMYINQYRLPVCIIVIDNNGGGIFNMLPIARNKKLLNPYFITPHNQNINKLSKAFGLRYKEITSKNLLHQYILKFFKDKKPTVLHIITDISLSTKYLEQLKKDLLNKL